MSKVSEAKKAQGFRKKGATCSNCENLKFEILKRTNGWSKQVFEKKTNLRCGIGNFATGLSNHCNHHEFLPEEK